MATLMANSGSDGSVELIGVIHRLALKLGVPTLRAHLLKLDKAAIPISDVQEQQLAIKIICDNLKIKPAALKQKTVFEERYWAIIFVCVILHKHANLSFEQIAPHLNFAGKTVANKIWLFGKLDKKNSVDKEKLELFEKIEQEIIAKKLFKKK